MNGSGLRVRVRRVRSSASLPSPAYAHDAGLDLAAAEAVELPPGGRASVPCGIELELPEGTCALVLPRSGLAARHGVTLLNAPGLIDAGFRGEVCAIVHNTDREHAFRVEPGMRIAQLLVLPVPPVALEEVDELAPSERGVRGFGSSGVA